MWGWLEHATLTVWCEQYIHWEEQWSPLNFNKITVTTNTPIMALLVRLLVQNSVDKQFRDNQRASGIFFFFFFAKFTISGQFDSVDVQSPSAPQVHDPDCLWHKMQKHFQNVMLVGMASEVSKNYRYKCVDRSRHNGIKGAKAKCAN